jgi:hypothetical protein
VSSDEIAPGTIVRWWSANGGWQFGHYDGAKHRRRKNVVRILRGETPEWVNQSDLLPWVSRPTDKQASE